MHGWGKFTSIRYYHSDSAPKVFNAYSRVREKISRQLVRQSDHYNQKVHGRPYDVGEQVWVLFPRCHEETLPALEWPICGG